MVNEIGSWGFIFFFGSVIDFGFGLLLFVGIEIFCDNCGDVKSFVGK